MEAGISPLLESEDMLLMGNRPDWKCVFTYVQSFYRKMEIESKHNSEGEVIDEENESKAI